MKITLDKIASSTARLELPREVEVSPHIEAKEGNVIAVRALMEKSVYDRLELTSGRMAKINKGDVIALIEAMKLFNEIRSTAGGKVKRIFAENGQLVRAHQPLVELEPI